MMTESNISPKADEDVATGVLMPLVSLRKHYKIGLRLFLAITLLGIPLAWFKGQSIYSATALVYVAPRVATILSENKEQEIPSYQQYKQFSEQQAGTIGRYDILLASLDKLGDKRFVWQKAEESDRRAAERLQAALLIKPVNDSYLISVVLESDKAEGLEEIVNTVVETYIENAHEQQLIYASKERVQILYDQRNKLKSLIADKKKTLASLSQQLSVTVFVDTSVNPYDQLLASSQLAYSEAQRELMKAEAGLLIFEDPKNPQVTALDAIVADMVYKDPGLISLKANMYERRSQLIKLISGLDPKHPGYDLLKKQIDTLESEVSDAINQETQDVKQMLIEERRAEVVLTRHIEQDLLAQITAQKNNASWFSTHYNDALTFNRDIKSLYEQLKQVEDRIGFLELESKSPGFIRLESLARPPELPIRGGHKKLLFSMMIFGLFSGLGLAILIDLFDRRIRTAGQVEKFLGYKPLAALIEPDEETNFSKIIADKKRRLALAIAREHKQSGKSSSLILLTSVNHASGVTSLAMDLAMDYQNMDERVVVVEVNSLKPNPCYVSEQTQLGLLDLARHSELDVSQVVSDCDTNYPARISIGLFTEDLLSGHLQLQAALAKISQSYSLVILDAAPVLFAADTEFFIGISDMSLLLIAAQQTSFGELKRSVQVLERISPNVVSFIVTRLEVFNGGGYYASLINADAPIPLASKKWWSPFLIKNA